MANSDDGAKAIAELNQSELKGRNIKVNEAKPRESNFSSSPGRGSGGDRGNRW
jgi:hypothetical protein